MVKRVGRRAGSGYVDHHESDTSESELLSTEEGRIENGTIRRDTHPHHEAVSGPVYWDYITHDVEFDVDETQTTDVQVFHRRHFDDNKFRMTVNRSGTMELWTTEQFQEYTRVNDDLGYPLLQSHTVLPDGKFVAFDSYNDATTNVWTGYDLANLQNQGQVLDRADCGVIYEPLADLIHIYPEANDGETDYTSNTMEHWTVPVDDLTNATQHATAIDVSSRIWETGDPEIYEVNGTWHMFLDSYIPDGNDPWQGYRIVQSTSTDLYNWTITEQPNSEYDHITYQNGGDPCFVEFGGSLMGFTEFPTRRIELVPKNLPKYRNAEWPEGDNIRWEALGGGSPSEVLELVAKNGGDLNTVMQVLGHIPRLDIPTQTRFESDVSFSASQWPDGDRFRVLGTGGGEPDQNLKIQHITSDGTSDLIEIDGNWWTGGKQSWGGSDTTADSMTADPESATEDGYLSVEIGGTSYQIPLYQE